MIHAVYVEKKKGIKTKKIHGSTVVDVVRQQSMQGNLESEKAVGAGHSYGWSVAVVINVLTAKPCNPCKTVHLSDKIPKCTEV